MSAPTRRGPAPAGRPPSSVQQNAAVGPQGTSAPDPHAATRGSIVRLTGDVEALAVDLLDRMGPAGVTVLAGALLALAEGVVA